MKVSGKFLLVKSGRKETSRNERYFPERPMEPKNPKVATGRVLRLITDQLGLPHKGEALALRMGAAVNRGAGLTRRYRNWIDAKDPPRQFGDMLNLLDEAGLLPAEVVAAWRGISQEDAALAVADMQAKAAAARAQALDQAETEAPAPDAQKPASRKR